MPREKKPEASLRKQKSVSIENGLHDLATCLAADTPGRSASDVNNSALEEYLEEQVGPVIISFVREYGIDPKIPFSVQKEEIRELAKDHWRKTKNASKS